jgi:hypothetical protein
MGDISPGTDVRDACHQRVDVPVDAVEICNLSGNPAGWKPLLEANEMAKAMTQQPSMAVG